MHEPSHYSPLAQTYAEALLELVDEQKGNAEEAGAELSDIQKILESEPNGSVLLTDPAIGHAKRGQLLQRIFSGRVSPLILKFLTVLHEKGRLELLKAVVSAYDDLLDQRTGSVEVDITVAQKLDDSTLSNVGQRIGQALSRQAVIHQYVDESIIGGLILRVRDQLIDGSVRTQLASLREQILSASPR